MSDDLLHAVARQRPQHYIQTRHDIPNPSAGADFTINVPGHEDWRILGVTMQFASSAVVASRFPSLVIDDQSSIGGRVQLPVPFTASNTIFLTFAADWSDHAAALPGGAYCAGIPKWVVPGGWRLRTITQNIDVGDQYSNISYMIEILNEPPWRNPMVGTAYDDAIEAEIAQQMQGG